MKLNLGCGFDKHPDFLNVDVSDECSPDMTWDLEKTPWPWDSDSVEAVRILHCLEHLGADHRVFREIVRELYRVCRDGAEILIKVPHPRHDDFINDPTHVRVITPGMLSLLSRRNNEEWRRNKVANTALAIYWGVNFDIVRLEYILEEPYRSQLHRGEISSERIAQMERELNNVIKEIGVSLVVRK